MMKKLIFLLLFLPTFVFAQFTEDFESGDISTWTQSNTERWGASDVSPINGNYSLHHIFDNPDSGEDQISIELPAIDLTAQNVTWRFKIRHGYNPSSSNNWSVFILSDDDANQMYPGGNVNGYAVGVNYTGSDDTLRLWKITAGNASEVVTTSINWQEDIGTSLAPAIEINNGYNGEWDIRININGDFNDLTHIGSGMNETLLYPAHFGLYYKYSSSQDMKLWIDDLYVEKEDTIIPQVLNFEIIDSTRLKIDFNESVDSLIAVNTSNYFVDNSIGNPDSVSINEIQNSVELFFGSSFINETYYQIDISNIEDLSGNMMSDTTIQFLYFIIEPHHVVINEIMADPNPPVNSLPNEEYIELFNTTNFDIDLSNWKMISGTSNRDLPSYILESNSYVILCSETAAEELNSYGNVIAFSSFTNIITNSGTTVKIISDQEIVIDSVAFTIDWYQDPEKDDGGWSLERIDPLNFCSGITNWKASENANGGTPGFENSVFGPNQDTLPPEIEKLELVASQQLRLYFNEPIENATATNIENFTVNQGIGNPYSVHLQNNDMEIDLLFLNPFPEEKELILTIENISDWCENVMPLTEINFTYYVEQPFDVVINEIMADPEPVVDLPEYEYIEIYNTTDYDIGITDWTISAGSTVREIPSAIIMAAEYIVLCSEDAAIKLEGFGKTIAVPAFPSLANSGQSLILKNRDGKIISSVTYSDRWYKNEYNADGGWSLEQIDPLNPCGEGENWEASKNEKGGTPGQINSIDAENPDTESPELLRAAPVDQNTVQLFFSESVHPETAIIKNNYRIDHGFGNPDTIDIITPENKFVLLSFVQPFESNTNYEVEITGTLTDCAGNIISGKTTATFAIPQNPDELDLVINEILFNPFAEGVDFVEIYNRSDKVFDLNQLRIASYDDEANDYKSVVKASDEGHLIFPGEYMVITENPDIVMEQYYTQNPDGFAKVSSLPAYNNDKGRVIIMDKSENTVDNFAYTEDMHFALLASNKGVSLERINYERPTSDKTNWHSASEVVGFATPAYENSQYNPQIDLDEKITIDPEIFSPDNDGYNDVTNISFNFDESGYVANIKIFDARGRLVKYHANNLLLGINQTITWDGLDDKNQKAPMGVYVVFIELFDLEGNVKQYKKSVVVASKLQ